MGETWATKQLREARKSLREHDRRIAEMKKFRPMPGDEDLAVLMQNARASMVKSVESCQRMVDMERAEARRKAKRDARAAALRARPAWLQIADEFLQRSALAAGLNLIEQAHRYAAIAAEVVSWAGPRASDYDKPPPERREAAEMLPWIEAWCDWAAAELRRRCGCAAAPAEEGHGDG